MKELKEGAKAGAGRIRRGGGGRKSTASKDSRLSEDLERLVEPVTRGDPESPLRWTNKSGRKPAREMQQLTDGTGLAIMVCHLPPGTSKWNNTPHRLFAWISQNWRGKPLISYAVILKLIAATTTEAGLSVRCQLDTNSCRAGRKISMVLNPFHGEWNYTILPRAVSI